MIDAKTKQKLLEGIYKFGNIYMSCLSVGISRADYYRWIKKDNSFKEKAEEAMRIGRENFVDICEGGLIKNVKNGNQRAIEYGLRFNSERYKSEKSSDNALFLKNAKQKTLEDLFDDYEDSKSNVTITKEEFEKLKDMAMLPKVNIEIVKTKDQIKQIDNQSN